MKQLKLRYAWGKHKKGDIVGVPGVQADFLIRQGIAEAVVTAPLVEAAAMDHAPVKRGRGRPRKHPKPE